MLAGEKSMIAGCRQTCETSGPSSSGEQLMYQGTSCLLKMHQVYQGKREFSGLISLNKIARSGMGRTRSSNHCQLIQREQIPPGDRACYDVWRFYSTFSETETFYQLKKKKKV